MDDYCNSCGSFLSSNNVDDLGCCLFCGSTDVESADVVDAYNGYDIYSVDPNYDEEETLDNSEFEDEDEESIWDIN